MNSTIEGVVIKDLITHADNRGFFREIIHKTDDFFSEGFGQWNHSMMLSGVTKAWHYHKRQVDWWYVCTGVLRVGLCDMRPESPTYKKTMDFQMGDHLPSRILRIPQVVAHGCQVIQGPVNLFYVVSEVYDSTDELRIPYNDPAIDFDWLKPREIK
jgi:dTDP-4-dehydrorhamnose 3,5-epimerase